MAKRILVIDDEKDMRVYLGALFTKAGYDVEVAINGEDGLSKARNARPDLITLDLLMPKKSGLKAYSELRNSPLTRDVPIVIVSGLGKQEDFFGEDLGSLPKPDAVCEKPIVREDFLAKVKEVLGE
jgi:CheY-like chemotaxis protein